jgi:MHS family alpha-ketoglutarate permease-like MFS transporter
MLVLLVLQKLLLSPDQLEAWGWRIPFAIGAGLSVVVYFMRRDMHETEAFLEARELGTVSNPLRELMQHPREVAIVVGLTLGGTVAFYTYTTYMQKFLVNSAGLSKDTSTVISAATLFCYMCLQPVVGAISDVVGRRPVLLSFGVLGTALTVPILSALQNTKDAWTAFFLIMAALLIVSGYTAINAIVKAELFPTRVRAIGVGFPYAVTVALFGGSAEYVALYLKEIGHATVFYWYVSGCVFVSLAVYALMRDTRYRSAMRRSV